MFPSALYPACAEWARALGLTYTSMQHRLARGWSMERIASQPQRGACRG
jgi:hypothetical protein